VIPQPDLQLQVAIRALRDVVAPSIDPSDRLATEQLMLSIATLELVRRRFEVIEPYLRAEIEDALRLGEQLHALADGTEQAAALRGVMERVRTAMGEPGRRRKDLEELLRELHAANCSVVDTCGQGGQHDVALAVTMAMKAPVDRARAWCLPAGFESDPTAVGELEEHLR
jgi:hypothetical protein